MKSRLKKAEDFIVLITATLARKLQIHSAAGLTIYAIANQLVQLDELQIK